MSSDFVTENSGGLGNYTFGRVGLIMRGARGVNNRREYFRMLREAAKESLVDAFCLIFHTRDCRGGKGERDLGRTGLAWLFINYTAEFMQVADLIGEYGRWDDIIFLFPGVLPIEDERFVYVNYDTRVTLDRLPFIQSAQIQLVKIMGDQLALDRERLDRNEKISFCAKWAPTEGDRIDRIYRTVEQLVSVMGITPRVYRKRYTTPLRRALDIVETKMCGGRWSEINLGSVPSVAKKRLKNAFAYHSVVGGEGGHGGRGCFRPHGLVAEMREKGYADSECEKMWGGFLSSSGISGRTLFVLDTKIRENKVYDVACAIILLGLGRSSGVFSREVISFGGSPKFHEIPGGGLYEQYKHLTGISSGEGFGLKEVFELILGRYRREGKSTLPEAVFILTDTTFDESGGNLVNFEPIEEVYRESGLKFPGLVFWNIKGFKDSAPVVAIENNTVVISGFSNKLVDSVGKGFFATPEAIMRSTIDDERYDPIRRALS